MLRRYKLLCLLAALLLMLLPAAVAEEGEGAAVAEPAVDAEAAGADETPAEEDNGLPEGVPETYRLVVEGSEYNLYLREDSMSVVVECRANGALMFSAVEDASTISSSALGQAQSGVVMQYLAIGSSSISQETVDLISTGNTQVHTIDYDYTVPNGFKATISYTNLGITFSVVVELEENDLKVSVPREEIRQEMYGSYSLSTLTLFPFMGASYLGGDTGYMLVPDGQGALIELKDNEKRYRSLYYDTPVYGSKIKDDKNGAGNSPTTVSTEPDIMPVFGMAHTDKGIAFLGVIEQGDLGASIRAYPNGAVNLAYDRTSALFEYSYRFTQMMGAAAGSGGMDARLPELRSFDIVQHFLFLSGEEANYTGMAVAYRNYLEEHGAFASARLDDFDVQLDVLGLEKENFVLGKQNVVMTTFEDAAVILADLKEKGAGSLSMVFRGWQEGGLSAALPTDDFNPAGALGGSKGLRTLLEGAASRKIDLYLEADFLRMNADTHPVLSYSAFKKVDSQTWSRPTYGDVYETMYYLTPSKSLEIGQSVLEKLRQGGVKGVSLVSITSFLSDYYENNAVRDAVSMAECYSRLCHAASGSMNARLSAANAYLWPCATSLSDLPITGSDYIFTTCDVPFLAIALSGRIPCYAEYTNFQANTNRFFLRLVEQGIRPAFLLTMEDPIALKNTNSSNIYSSRYELYGDMIVSWSQELGALHEKLDGASIVGHEMLGDMTHVTWSNGTEVFLNYGEDELTQDGVTVASMSYVVKEGGE
ncbi:MAG: DUF5696 domain-containing protein [Aristaeellaceae bacterium]